MVLWGRLCFPWRAASCASELGFQLEHPPGVRLVDLPALIFGHGRAVHEAHGPGVILIRKVGGEQDALAPAVVMTK
jgi:hypothetical protein